jgi:tetratricopeptide (TPR) repeat protein
LAASLIVAAITAAFANSFRGAFVFDDTLAIENNQTIRHLWPIGPVLSPPLLGATVAGRPLLNLSFAINYALGGRNPWGYHAVNLSIHILAALLLFGILRRTFRLPRLRNRFGPAATPLALVITLLWALHPLQTESITYIAQRAESGCGLLYLLVLYCALRGATGKGEGETSRGDLPCSPSHSLPISPSAFLWYSAAILACLLGTAFKEVIVSAPLFVLLYDRTLLSGSFRQAVRQRWALYLGLLATEGLLAYIVKTMSLPASFLKEGVNACTYCRTQPEVIFHYLRLCFWPWPLCVDYCWPVATTLGQVLPGLIVLGLLAAATLYGLLRRTTWSLLGAWFFLILAPTSSILPLYQLATEHRLYLPLTAVLTALVLGAYGIYEMLSRRGPRVRLAGIVALGCLVGTATVGLATLTILRNEDYRSAVRIWRDTVAKSPWNPGAHFALGADLIMAGMTDEGIAHLEKAIALYPRFAKAHDDLAVVFHTQGRVAEAIYHWTKALQYAPQDDSAHYNLGLALQEQGRLAEAITHYEKAIHSNPRLAKAHNELAVVLQQQGKLLPAIAHYEKALEIEPDSAEVHNNLGGLFAEQRKFDDAIAHYEKAAAIDAKNVAAQINLGNTFVQLGRIERAIPYFQKAVAIAPCSAETHNDLAIALRSMGKVPEAIAHYRKAVALSPQFAVARYNLAIALYEDGQTREALAQFRTVEELRAKGVPVPARQTGIEVGTLRLP